jgi:iron complex outermembrane receptor protein
MTRSCSSAHWRRGRAVAHATLASFLIPFLTLSAQQSRRDSTRADSARRLEGVTISAVRAADRAPISQKTITQAEIEPRYFGQDVPMVLQGTAPSLTAYAETGTYWGYSYIRLRGVDQSRINLTIDGIPLNDPEDQVLYFADFPDLTNSLHSVQVQRGVGTSTNGTASFAGSINLETTPLAATRRGGNAQIEGGSWGSMRGSAEYATGLTSSRFAAYGRVSALKTDGYRYHSGVEGRSLFFSGGYFGDRDVVKFTATTGTMKDTMAYLAVPLSVLDTNRRVNLLTPRERDGFSERLAALSYTRLVNASSSWSTTVYRLSTAGDYDVVIDSLWNFNLKYSWYGATSAWTYRSDALHLDLGANANTYARDHSAYSRPDLVTPLYFNTGHKQDVSGFVKAGYTIGRATLFGDVQARRAEFRYTPDTFAGIAEQKIDWSFLNPKAGVTVAVSAPLSVYASIGQTKREPTRTDMFAGFDNLDTSNVSFVGSLARVRPERVRDLEAGLTYRTTRVDASANLYSMDFRDEIAAIGALSYIGSPLRQNVSASYRRGVEADVTLRATPQLSLTANAWASKNRIREYTDNTGDAPVTYRNVEPLLTPNVTAFGRAQYAATKALTVAAEGLYTGESFLTNTGDCKLMLPSATTVNASVGYRYREAEIVARVNNATDSRKYGSGYDGGGEPAYFILPPRNLFVSLKVAF